MTRTGFVDLVDKCFPQERLREAIHAALGEAPNIYVFVRRHENRWTRPVAGGQALVKLDPRHPWKPDVHKLPPISVTTAHGRSPALAGAGRVKSTWAVAVGIVTHERANHANNDKRRPPNGAAI